MSFALYHTQNGNASEILFFYMANYSQNINSLDLSQEDA